MVEKDKERERQKRRKEPLNGENGNTSKQGLCKAVKHAKIASYSNFKILDLKASNREAKQVPDKQVLTEEIEQVFIDKDCLEISR